MTIKDYVTAIKNIDMEETVSDEKERKAREKFKCNYELLYDGSKEIPSLLKRFFSDSASFTITENKED